MYKANKPSIFTAQQYDTKVSVEIDHSDLDFSEVMDSFQTLIVGMGYNMDSFKEWIKQKAYEYEEEERENVRDMGEVTFSKEEQKVIEDYVANLPEEDIDMALVQHNADEEEFNDYGMRINKTK